MVDIPLVSWTAFKALFTQKNGATLSRMQYVDHALYYQVFFFEAGSRYAVSIFKDGGADQLNFEAVYQPSANAAFSDHVIVDSGNISVYASSSSGLTINGTVDQGTPASVANSWPVKLTNGASAAGLTTTTPAGTELALIVRNIPSGVQTVQASSTSGLTVNGSVSVSNFPSVQQVLASSAGGLTVNGTVVSKLQDGAGTNLTSQASGGQRALDVGIDVAGVQVDPRSIRLLTSADVVSVQALASSGVTINGTVTANIGTTNGLALDATLTGGTQKTKIVDTGGTNAASISAAGAVKVDGSAVTQPVSIVGQPLTILASAAGGLTINGTVAADQGGAPWSIVGSSANGATANPNPVVVGGRDDTGVITTVDVDDVMGQNSVYSVSAPIEADAVHDGTMFGLTVEFALPTNGTETNFLFIKNPTGTAKLLYFDNLVVDVLTKGQQATFRGYANPTTSANGTTVSISSFNIGGGFTTSMQAFTSPTVSARNTRIKTFSGGADSNSLIVPLTFGLALQPNNTLLITGTPTANNVSVACSLRWMETTP